MPHYPIRRRFVHDGIAWTAWRRVGVWVGTLPYDARRPNPRPTGIRFVSEANERRFLPLDVSELPRAAQFRALENAALIESLRCARTDPAVGS
jgi:hypothetical protein